MAGFTMIPNELIDGMANMTPAEFKVTIAVYRLIIGHEKHRKEKKRRISNSELQAITGLSKQGLVNVIKSIESQGYVSRERGNTANSNLWVVNSVDQSSQLSVLEVVNSVDQSSQLSVLEVVNSVDQSSQLSVPSTSGLNKEENKDINKEEEIPLTPRKTQKPKKAAVEPVFELPSAIDTLQVRQLLADFEKNRQEMKKPLSQRAADLLIKKLADVGEVEAVARLQAAVINNWQGAFYPGDEEKYSHLRNGVNGHANGRHYSTKSNPQPYTPNGPEHAEYLAEVAAYEAAKRAKQPVGTT